MNQKKKNDRFKLYRSLHNQSIYDVVRTYQDKDNNLIEERRLVISLDKYGLHRKTGSVNYYLDYFALDNKKMYKIHSIKLKNYFKQNQLIINYSVIK